MRAGRVIRGESSSGLLRSRGGTHLDYGYRRFGKLIFVLLSWTEYFLFQAISFLFVFQFIPHSGSQKLSLFFSETCLPLKLSLGNVLNFRSRATRHQFRGMAQQFSFPEVS